MNPGDLIKYVGSGYLKFSPHVGRTGIVLRVDKDFYGATQAFKRDPNKDTRGKCVDSRKPDFIGHTKKGVRDRVLVLWADDNHLEHVDSQEVKIVN